MMSSKGSNASIDTHSNCLVCTSDRGSDGCWITEFNTAVEIAFGEIVSTKLGSIVLAAVKSSLKSTSLPSIQLECNGRSTKRMDSRSVASAGNFILLQKYQITRANKKQIYS